MTAAGFPALLGSSLRLVVVLLLAGAGLMVLGSLLVTVDHPAAQIACVLVWLLVQAYGESVMDDMDNDSALQPLGRLPAWTLLTLPVGVLTGVAFLWLDARGRRGTALPSSR